MVLFLELRALNNGQVALLKCLNGLVEYLRDICTSKLSVVSVTVNLICTHIMSLFYYPLLEFH